MYPELPQDMGEIWPHWVRSVWPQKMGSARLAVLWPRLAKVTIDKVKNVFWLKVIFFKTSIQINFIFVVSNGQSDIASFCRIFRAFWQINSMASWPTVPPPLLVRMTEDFPFFCDFPLIPLKEEFYSYIIPLIEESYSYMVENWTAATLKGQWPPQNLLGPLLNLVLSQWNSL